MRDSGTDIIINLTAGMGGDLEVDDQDPRKAGPGTDLVNALERLVHVEELLPEICTLDCGTLNFGDGNMIYVSTPNQLRAGAKRIRELGVKPELEVFDTGHLWFAKRMHEEGLLEEPPMFQLCLGIPWGAPADTNAMKAHARHAARRRRLGRLRHRAHADAHGGPGRAAGRQCARRAGGQYLARHAASMPATARWSSAPSRSSA